LVGTLVGVFVGTGETIGTGIEVGSITGEESLESIMVVTVETVVTVLTSVFTIDKLLVLHPVQLLVLIMVTPFPTPPEFCTLTLILLLLKLVLTWLPLSALFPARGGTGGGVDKGGTGVGVGTICAVTTDCCCSMKALP